MASAKVRADLKVPLDPVCWTPPVDLGLAGRFAPTGVPTGLDCGRFRATDLRTWRSTLTALCTPGSNAARSCG